MAPATEDVYWFRTFPGELTCFSVRPGDCDFVGTEQGPMTVVSLYLGWWFEVVRAEKTLEQNVWKCHGVKDQRSDEAYKRFGQKIGLCVNEEFGEK